MKVLVACEYSGIVRDAFLERGHDAWSCDLLPTERNSNRHIMGDVRDVLNDGWDLLIPKHLDTTEMKIQSLNLKFREHQKTKYAGFLAKVEKLS